jgi:hypothetical protein
LKDEEMVSGCSTLLGYRLGAYIEGWIRNKIRLLKIRNESCIILSAASCKQETHKLESLA